MWCNTLKVVLTCENVGKCPKGNPSSGENLMWCHTSGLTMGLTWGSPQVLWWWKSSWSARLDALPSEKTCWSALQWRDKKSQWRKCDSVPYRPLTQIWRHSRTVAQFSEGQGRKIKREPILYHGATPAQQWISILFSYIVSHLTTKLTKCTLLNYQIQLT